jgi:hypothetical protein
LKTAVTPKSLKLLNPRSSDTNILGQEPTWTVQPTQYRITALSKAFTWYNYFYGKKDARDMIVNYLETHGRKDDVRLLKGIPDSAIRLTTGWLCRMTMLGLELNDSEQSRLQSQLREILDSKQNTVEEAPEEPVVPKITIQDRLREKANECDGELEGLFDEFLLSGAKMTADFKPVVIMRGMNIAPQMVSQISDNWKRKLSEFERVVEGKDAQLVEGYSHLSKIQMRNVIKFCEAVINDCGAYVQIKKVERKPRKVRAVPPEKRAAKFKIQAEFAELKLKSLPAASLVDKSEAWLYDTKKRKLIHLVADEYAKAFTVKSNSIIGFSTAETLQKTVRKPADTLKTMTTAGKPAARRVFKELTTTETAFNGRGTENLIILRVW